MISPSLPILRDISSSDILSFVLGLLTVVLSLTGLLFQVFFYPIEELQYSSVATDLVNVIMVVPVLI